MPEKKLFFAGLFGILQLEVGDDHSQDQNADDQEDDEVVLAALVGSLSQAASAALLDNSDEGRGQAHAQRAGKLLDHIEDGVDIGNLLAGDQGRRVWDRVGKTQVKAGPNDDMSSDEEQGGQQRLQD